MRRRLIASALTLFGASLLLAATAEADRRSPGGIETFRAHLRGVEEVPVISTIATGDLTIKVNALQGTIDYVLNYENLQGTVTQSHIHLGQAGVAGGVSLWLCQTAASPAPAAVAAITPTCPASGFVTGSLTSANVVGPTGQLVAAGEIAEVISLIRTGYSYGNVHSSAVPGGEVRGQLR
jgi:hypothetical protein